MGAAYDGRGVGCSAAGWRCGSPAVRDALLAEWAALDFSMVRRAMVLCAPTAEETRWALFCSAEERAAESAAAESAAVADWAWMVHEVVRTSNFLADLKADTSARWRAEIALPRYRWRHCWQCGEGEEQLGFGWLACEGTPHSTGWPLAGDA